MKFDLLLRSLHQRILAIAEWLGSSVAMLGGFLSGGGLGARPVRVRSFDLRSLPAVLDFRRRGSDRRRSR